MIGTWLRDAQSAADLDPVEPGHHHVEHDEVEALFGEAIQRLPPVARRDDLVPLLAKRVRQKRLNRLARRRRGGCEPKPPPCGEVSFTGSAMFDPRIYRAALLPAVAAFVLLMFSLEPIPSALQQPVSTPTFDSANAARTTRSIVAEAPDRTPGLRRRRDDRRSRAPAVWRDRGRRSVGAGLRLDLRRRRRQAAERPADAPGQLGADPARGRRSRLDRWSRRGDERGRDGDPHQHRRQPRRLTSHANDRARLHRRWRRRREGREGADRRPAEDR